MKKFLTSPVPYMVTAIAIITFWGGQQFAQKRMALDRVRADQATIARLRSDQEARPDPWCEGRGFKAGFECEGMRAIILHKAEEEARKPTPPAKRAAKLPWIARTSGAPAHWLDDAAVKRLALPNTSMCSSSMTFEQCKAVMDRAAKPVTDTFQGKRLYWEETGAIRVYKDGQSVRFPEGGIKPEPYDATAWKPAQGVWVETPGGSLKFVRVEAPRKP